MALPSAFRVAVLPLGAGAGAALADRVGRALRLDTEAGEALESPVQVLDRDRDVAVAGPDLVGIGDIVVVRELEPGAVAGQAHEDVGRLVADRHPVEDLEAELLVEVDRCLRVEDAVTGVDQLGHGRRLSLHL